MNGQCRRAGGLPSSVHRDAGLPGKPVSGKTCLANLEAPLAIFGSDVPTFAFMPNIPASTLPAFDSQQSQVQRGTAARWRAAAQAASIWFVLALLIWPGMPRSQPVALSGDAGLFDTGPFVPERFDDKLADGPGGRTLPLRLRVPAPCTGSTPRPVILFSHGLGGSKAGGARWGEHWASHGFVVVHLQHPGSDESLWRTGAGTFDPARLRLGMTPEQAILRARDVVAVLDWLAGLQARDPRLACLDLARVGMSGHSFGAQTTQVVAGQGRLIWPAAANQPASAPPAEPLREPRIRAAIAFSPAIRGADEDSLAAVTLPFMVITGALDDGGALTGVTPAMRRAVYEKLPPGNAWLLWFAEGDHMVFNGGAPRVARQAADTHVLRMTAGLSLAFWRAMLQNDAQAAVWLSGDGPRAFLSSGDAFESRRAAAR
jgi:predicted dienelactone hydrolase